MYLIHNIQYTTSINIRKRKILRIKNKVKILSLEHLKILKMKS